MPQNMTQPEQKTRLTPEQIQAVIDGMNQAKAVKHLLSTAIKITGMKMISYHHIAGPGSYEHKHMRRHVSYNLPPALERFLNTRELTQDDPGVAATFSSGTPVWLSDMLEHESVKGLPNESQVQAFFELTGDGLLLALFGPEGRKGYAFVTFGKSKEQCDPIFAWQIHSLLQMLYVRYCIMLAELRKKVKLTKRETEVLGLIALGKTNPEIGIILNISKNTVASYIKGIFLKLDTSDRVTTAMRARALNLLA